MRGRRADIQGLRALAVVGVLAAHIGPWPAGGVLGVDVFFVISGFVITQVLLRRREGGIPLRLRAFYARRARRILPLALLVIVVTVVVSGLVFGPLRAAQVREDAVWAAVFLANWWSVIQGVDYFAQGRAASMLLHYWSLAVEEQFYLIWPLLVLLATRRYAARHRSVAIVAVSIGLASLVWAFARVGADPVTSYYSSLTRAWQLAAGAALATVPAERVGLSGGSRQLLGWGGALLVVGSFLVIDPSLGLPVPGALLPTVATLLVLLSGLGAPVESGPVLLTNPVSRYLGDISFGLYLWHWPVLVVAAAWPLSAGARAGVALVTLALAAATYHLVERPVLDAPARHRPRPGWADWWRGQRRGIAAGAAALLVTGAAAGSVLARAIEIQDPVASAAPGGIGAVVADPPPEVDPPTNAAQTPPTPSVPPSVTPPAPTVQPTSAPADPGPPGIPLGDTGARLQEGLRGGLAATGWPARLAPDPANWGSRGDPLSVSGKGCSATVASDPSSCTFGNPAGPEIVVYGDSLGVAILPAFVEAFGADYKVRGLTKMACAVNGADADFGQDDWAIPCTRHREAVVAYVRSARPAVLVMVQTYAWATKLKSKATGAAAAREWQVTDERFVASVKEHVGAVVILGPSIPGVAFADCYRPSGSPRACTTGIPPWWQRIMDAEARVVGATFIDTRHWYCVQGRCPLLTTLGDTVLKLDYLHTSLPYARLLGPDLRHLLTTAGVLPR